MKRTLLTAILGVAIGTLSAVNAMAQIPTKLVMSVPFSFQIHGKTLPPGEYTLARANDGVMYISCLKHPKLSQMVITATAHDGRDLAPRVTFHRYGDRFYMTEVYIGPDQPTWELLPGAAEREAQKSQVAIKMDLPVRTYTAMNR